MTVFYPNALLCKRFNVPRPHPELQGKPKVADTLAAKEQDTLELLKSERDRILREEKLTSGQDKQKEASIKEIEENPLDSTANFDEVVTKPTMDIFKAIFEESESEDNEEDIPQLAETLPVSPISVSFFYY